MASAFSHAMVAVTLGHAFKSKELRGGELLLGAFCSVMPDLDVIGFSMGIQYGDVWGHRGLTHSFLFADLLAGSLGVCGTGGRRRHRRFFQRSGRSNTGQRGYVDLVTV